MLSSGFPEAVSVDEFLEVLGRYRGKLFHQTEHPDYLLSLLTVESIEELLNGTVAGFGPVEANLAHSEMLTQM